MNILNLSSAPTKTNALQAVNAGLKSSIGFTIKRLFQAKNISFDNKLDKKNTRLGHSNFALNTNHSIQAGQKKQELTKNSFVLNGAIKKEIIRCEMLSEKAKTNLNADIASEKQIALYPHKNSTLQSVIPVATSEAIFLLDIGKGLYPISEAASIYKASPVATNSQSTLSDQKNGKLKSSARLKVVHRFDGSIEMVCAGHLVISGCIADVCAELERMAQYE